MSLASRTAMQACRTCGMESMGCACLDTPSSNAIPDLGKLSGKMPHWKFCVEVRNGFIDGFWVEDPSGCINVGQLSSPGLQTAGRRTHSAPPYRTHAKEDHAGLRHRAQESQAVTGHVAHAIQADVHVHRAAFSFITGCPGRCAWFWQRGCKDGDQCGFCHNPVHQQKHGKRQRRRTKASKMALSEDGSQ